jgi:single-stranded DNA-binding protein
MSFAQVTTTGWLVADPYYTAAEGTKGAYARFKILHNPLGRTRDGGDRPPVGIDVVCFGKTADTVNKYAKKGTQVLVSGRLVSNELALDKETKAPIKTKTGEYIINLQVEAQEFQLLGSKADNPATATMATASVGAADPAADPF